ncbi:MAG: hypothetical protein HY22_07190 [[Candidatus Thermochlorobacteriaceae] bacterium GBChlB]|nr:MAG: hypothetical protein HY22_07190 [[Candidatus Thermochlorobacteriaceae] bacterium GBChlB]
MKPKALQETAQQAQRGKVIELMVSSGATWSKNLWPQINAFYQPRKPQVARPPRKTPALSRYAVSETTDVGRFKANRVF